MACYQCACENQQEFGSEVAIHFPGIEGLRKPMVWTFPRLRVCLECGYADFRVPERELETLVTGVSADGTIVLPPRGEVSSANGSESDITERKDTEIEREQLIICASCKRIRDEQGDWKQREMYLRDRSAVDFSHGCCPECLETLYGKR